MITITRRFGLAAGLVAVFGLASACDPGVTAPPAEGPNLAVSIPATGLDEKVWVCNDDAAGISLDFTVTGTGITIVDAAPTIGPGNCTLVAEAGGGNNVTVTQTLATGYDFVRIDPYVVPHTTNNLVPDPSGPVLVPTITRQFGDRGRVFVFFNELTPGGGEGCTPGFWKNHTGLKSQANEWPTSGYHQGASYDAVFGVTSSFGGTLLDAVGRGGGGENALGRHAVAALLNAVTSVDYFYSAAAVIQIVQDAYATGDFSGAKDDLEAENGDDTFCPLPSNGPID